MTDPLDFRRIETLRNGLVVTISSLRADDRAKIAAAIGQLDRESIYLRLFGYRSELTEAGLDRIMSVNSDNDVALLVTTGSGADEIVIGSGRYFASPAKVDNRSAEVAFIVKKDHQGLGIAGRLLALLADIARRRGISAFEADVLGENGAMLSVFMRSGLPMQQRCEGAVTHVTLALAPK
jgi:RimJ/RimL family protein N-acetyltransferase